VGTIRAFQAFEKVDSGFFEILELETRSQARLQKVSSREVG